MRRILLVCIVIFFFFTTAWSQSENLQKQINEQVWKPFIKSFNSDDQKAFKAVHSKDLARVIQDNNQVIGYKEYFRATPDSVKAKWGDWKKNIELRFIERIADDGKAFEVGYYKTTNTNTATGKSNAGYGKFHVLLRKEHGTWKILMDADAGEGVNEAIFLTGKSME